MGSGPPNPPLDPRMGPANVYTYYWGILKPHPIVRIGICTTLLTFYRMRKFLNWRNILSWIPFGSDLDPNRLERESGGGGGGDWCMHTLSRKSKCIGGSRCVCVCVCVVSEFRHFLTLRFQSFVCRSLQKILIIRDVLESAFARESVLVFWSKRKCSDSSVVRDEWT